MCASSLSLHHFCSAMGFVPHVFSVQVPPEFFWIKYYDGKPTLRMKISFDRKLDITTDERFISVHVYMPSLQYIVC